MHFENMNISRVISLTSVLRGAEVSVQFGIYRIPHNVIYRLFTVYHTLLFAASHLSVPTFI